MTDEQKELITLSAKALGYEYVQPIYDDDCCDVITHEVMKNGMFIDFNPLTSRSDLQDLIVGLGISTEFTGVGIIASDMSFESVILEPYGTDKHQSLALAVIKTAADIWKLKGGNK